MNLSGVQPQKNKEALSAAGIARQPPEWLNAPLTWCCPSTTEVEQAACHEGRPTQYDEQ